MPVVSMKALLEAGVHFGHRTRRWNPKMKPYIFTERNGIHIIDLQQTLSQLDKSYELVRDIVAAGGTVLFVGTKKQAQETIVQEAERCEMPYINQRWLGGTLTNWRTIRRRIEQLIELEAQLARGDFQRLTKKEALVKQTLIGKLQRRLGGLRSVTQLPKLVFITDTQREDLAVKEANKLHIPIVAMVDSNCDPDPIDFVIPSNDDAIRAIRLIVGTIANAAIEGQQMRASLEAEAADDEAAKRSRDSRSEADDEQYLAPSLLARLRAGEFDESDGIDDDLEDASVDIQLDSDEADGDESPDLSDDADDDQPEESDDSE